MRESHLRGGENHIVAPSTERVEGRQAVLAVLGQKMVLVAAYHHLERATGHLKTDAVEQFAVGDMGISGCRCGIQHAAGDHKACRLAKEELGIDKERRRLRAVRTLGNMMVFHLLACHQCRAACTRVGSILIIGIGAGKTRERETQESTVVAALRHNGGIDLSRPHSVAHNKNHIARMRLFYLLLVPLPHTHYWQHTQKHNQKFLHISVLIVIC